jgi:hypothetical protein
MDILSKSLIIRDLNLKISKLESELNNMNIINIKSCKNCICYITINETFNICNIDNDDHDLTYNEINILRPKWCPLNTNPILIKGV